jgi:hypothetical protein
MSITRVALLATVLLATTNMATALHAQSLGDVAKKTEEARAKKAEEERVKADKAPSSGISQPVTCDVLLQHSLAWWLGSMPTSAERDQLAACLAGSGRPAPASPSVSPAAPSAAATHGWPTPSPGQVKPANWNTMNAMEQAQWLCRDDPSRITDRCKMVLTETPAQTAPGFVAVNDPCQSLVGLAYYTCKHPNELQPVPVARWTADTCNAEHQSLSLLSERINQTVAQLQALTALPPPGSTAKASPTYPPTYRCNSDSSGSQTTTTCRPDGDSYHVVSPAQAFSDSLSQSLAEHAAASRFNALAAQVQTQQNQFDTRFRAWESHCTKP